MKDREVLFSLEKKEYSHYLFALKRNKKLTVHPLHRWQIWAESFVFSFSNTKAVPTAAPKLSTELQGAVVHLLGPIKMTTKTVAIT